MFSVFRATWGDPYVLTLLADHREYPVRGTSFSPVWQLLFETSLVGGSVLPVVLVLILTDDLN
jgi:hypothetical protein